MRMSNNKAQGRWLQVREGYLFKLYFCGNRPPPYSYVEIIPGPNSSRAKTLFGSNPNHGVERKWPPTAMCGRGTAKVKASTSPPHRGTT